MHWATRWSPFDQPIGVVSLPDLGTPAARGGVIFMAVTSRPSTLPRSVRARLSGSRRPFRGCRLQAVVPQDSEIPCDHDGDSPPIVGATVPERPTIGRGGRSAFHLKCPTLSHRVHATMRTSVCDATAPRGIAPDPIFWSDFHRRRLDLILVREGGNGEGSAG
jgi:hypothetical protein